MRTNHTRITLNENPYIDHKSIKTKKRRISLHKSFSQDRTYYRKNDSVNLHPINNFNFTRFGNHFTKEYVIRKESIQENDYQRKQLIKIKSSISNLSRNENEKLKSKVFHLSHYSIMRLYNIVIILILGMKKLFLLRMILMKFNIG